MVSSHFSKGRHENSAYPSQEEPGLCEGPCPASDGDKVLDQGLRQDLDSAALVLEFCLEENSEPKLKYKRKLI